MAKALVDWFMLARADGLLLSAGCPFLLWAFARQCGVFCGVSCVCCVVCGVVGGRWRVVGAFAMCCSAGPCAWAANLRYVPSPHALAMSIRCLSSPSRVPSIAIRVGRVCYALNVQWLALTRPPRLCTANSNTRIPGKFMLKVRSLAFDFGVYQAR